MGILDGGLFGGLFDLNGDGRIDLGEEFMAYKMFEAVTKEEMNEDDLFEEEDDEDDDL